jgi:tRNA uridine 5-carboxymethylaminomethyl modification enzyme
MFTSRAEHRLRLRQDNADRRLTPLGRAVGLVDDARFNRLTEKEAEIGRVTALLEATRSGGLSLAQLLRQTETTWPHLTALLPELARVHPVVVQQVLYDAKYAGYLGREDAQIAMQQRLASQRIPEGFDFSCVGHLRAEAREKLTRIRPVDLAQAGRISGLTPADVAVLLVHLQRGG